MTNIQWMPAQHWTVHESFPKEGEGGTEEHDDHSTEYRYNRDARSMLEDRNRTGHFGGQDDDGNSIGWTAKK